MKYRVLGFLIMLSQLPIVIGGAGITWIGTVVGTLLIVILYKSNVDRFFYSKDKVIQRVLTSLVLLSILICWLFKYYDCELGVYKSACDKSLNSLVFIWSATLIIMMIYLYTLEKKLRDNSKND